eukprot:Gregarina_sp_Poly_1__7899@NODE_449_length_8316_cov_26_811735_g367_i0_p4_GENE_NODE_449_length_8316_cov_26_811735_g367_i0NODE_449_length_8316_cov_26_811735_g367_i0_p4_ORF_typecomplete_len380_score35_35Glyco_tranf_2_3/PF13641_6/0_22Glycos_transf_2/PF00535_26/4_3e02Glycos_transf_2/PF00535_26/0_79_NODE_449_length_8316_cov_26_811735_g367_i056666805
MRGNALPGKWPLAEAAKIVLGFICIFGVVHVGTSWVLTHISPNRQLSIPDLAFLSYPQYQATHVALSSSHIKTSVPMTLVVPCQAEDFKLLPVFLESLANQTVFPRSTHLILNLPPDYADGVQLGLIDNPLRVAKNIFTDLDQRKQDAQGRFANRKKVVSEALDYVVETRIPMSLSLQHIPNLTLHLRAGKHYAGDNRMYGANMSDDNVTSLVSFFDCDDYLHPQRTELVHRAFDLHSELEALIHGFTLIPLTQWDDLFGKFIAPIERMPNNKTFLWSYDKLHAALPVDAFANETNGEPQQKRGSLWFFPRGMDLPRYPPYSAYGHNGWLTIKRKVLAEIQYPASLARGQDSLYNWRLIRARRNFNMLPLHLAAYLRQR